jgi:putative SOS response-associated peptidase YedK
MCGRFLLATPPSAVAELFGIDQVEIDWPARYNIAPTQMVPVIRQRDQKRTLSLLRWGLVPSWADDPSIGNRMINARAESIDTRPAFRSAFQQRRCIVPADGFYEWKKLGPRRKQPMAILAADRQLLALAGLWERWRPRDQPDAPWLETCTILTCPPNDLLREVHDRMPVVLERQDVARWLDPAVQLAAALKPLLAPCPSQRLTMYPVGPYINTPQHDDPRCLEEVRPGEPPAQGMLWQA